MERKVIGDLYRAFPGTKVMSDSGPPWCEPDSYSPTVLRHLVIFEPRTGQRTRSTFVDIAPDVGPCAVCGGSIRRYGPAGRAVCARCHEHLEGKKP